MSDDDDVLGIDLDAWQAPPPPANIANGVIERMRREVTQVSVQALPVEQQPAPKPTRRWWIAGGVAAAIAATTLVTFALTRSGPPANARGITAGDRAAHIALGSSSADVDPNTVVSWRRQGARITAQQAGGIAAWRVDDDDTLTIETGLGSIEATNASLRVEVKMLDERKTIALSAITAAAVAAVTIVVYEGVVHVRDDGGTTTVAPGTAYQIRAKGDNTIVQDQALVGAAPVDPNRAAAQAEIDRLRAEIEAKEAERQLLVKQINGLLPDNLDRDDVSKVMKGLADQIRACADGWTGKVEIKMAVKADGTVGNIEATPANAKPNACVTDVVSAATFPPTKRGVVVKYPIVFGEPKNYDFSANPYEKPKTVEKKCDPEELEKLRARATEMFSSGQPAAALQIFETMYACDPQLMTLKLVVASACKARQREKAQHYWKKLPQSGRDQLTSLCVANGVMLDDLEDRSSSSAGTGRLKIVNSAGPAKVFVDGAAVGTTPIDMELAPGKHKVMFVVGADKHTFNVVIKAGETTSLSKSIE